jgi:hypothetical protein
MSVISRRESVVLKGMLSGMGRKTQCTLQADVIRPRCEEAREYTNVAIAEAPQDLPDGRYELRFDDRVCDIQRLMGNWINHFWSV